MTHPSSSRNRAVTHRDNSSKRTKSEPAPAPARRNSSAAPPVSTRVPVKSDPTLNEDDVAELEAHLAAERERMMAKIAAKRAAEEKARAEAAAAEKARQEAAAAAAAAAARAVPTPASDIDPAELAKFQKMLAAMGVRLVPGAVRPGADDSDGDAGGVPENDYSDTERVQVELLALLDLLGVVRAKDVQEHVLRDDGSRMSPSNVRYHMKKLANRGMVKKVEERYKLPGLGYRTRDVWSRDSQKLLEVLEGRKTVRS